MDTLTAAPRHVYIDGERSTTRDETIHRAKNESDNAVATKSPAALKSLRTTIDRLDLQILKLVNERASLAAEIGKVKTEHGAEVFSPAREEEVYQSILEHNKGPLDSSTIRGLP